MHAQRFLLKLGSITLLYQSVSILAYVDPRRRTRDTQVGSYSKSNKVSMKSRKNGCVRLLKVLGAIVLFFCGLQAHAQPAAPAGFHWHVAENGAGSFLRPDGWHVAEGAEGDSVVTLSISKEPLAEDGTITTGMTVKRISHVTERTGQKPTDYAQGLLATYRTKNLRVIASYGVPEQHGYQGYALRYNSGARGAETTANLLAIASTRGDVVYVLTLKAPAAEWSHFWERWHIMQSTMVLKD